MRIKDRTYLREENKIFDPINDNKIDENKIISKNFKKFFLSEDFENFIVDYNGDILGSVEKTDYAAVSVVGPIFALVTVRKGRIEDLLREVPEITYIQRSFPFTLTGLEKVKVTSSYIFMDGYSESLNGEGVLVGIIGTGIDYLNPRFLNSDGSTRVVAIWDQTIDDVPNVPTIFNSDEVYGKEYYKEEIDRAISENITGNNPYSIVKHKDEVGFGTAIAGIIGGRKLSQGDPLVSVAPKCEFAVVKLREAKKITLELNGVDRTEVPVYESAHIRGAILYLAEIQLKEKKPMVIYFPLGTNMGGHDGGSPIERYMDYYAERRGLEFVTDTGSQGASETHTSGQIASTGSSTSIEIEVDKNQKNLNVSIWFNRPDKVSIGITPPKGNPIQRIPAILLNGENIEVDINNSKATIQYFLSYISGVEFINILIKNVTGGNWKIDLFGDFISDGRYDAWLLQRELLETGTRFINPDPLVTLTIPSTSVHSFTTSYFNSKTGAPVSKAGKGFARDGRVEPDLCIGGTDILTTGLNNENVFVSGAATAGSILTGAVALILQWGFVYGNDKILFTPKIKTYIIRSLNKRPIVNYPNEDCGYGRLSFQLLFQNLRMRKKSNEEVKNYLNKLQQHSMSKLYVRIPEHVYENS